MSHRQATPPASPGSSDSGRRPSPPISEGEDFVDTTARRREAVAVTTTASTLPPQPAARQAALLPPMETLLLEFEAAYAHVVSPSVGSAVFTGQNNAVYGEIGPKSLYHLFARLRLMPGDVFVDLGSGTGSALAVAAFGFGARAYGVELDEQRTAIARRFLADLSTRLARFGGTGSTRAIAGDFTKDFWLPSWLSEAKIALAVDQEFDAGTHAAITRLCRHLRQNAFLVSQRGYGASRSEYRHDPHLQSFAVHVMPVEKVVVNASWTGKVEMKIEQFVFP